MTDTSARTQQSIQQIEVEALQGISEADSVDALKSLEVALLGRKGALTKILRGLKDLDGAERKLAGQSSNVAKKRLEEAIKGRRVELEKAAVDSALAGERMDPTQAGPEIPQGHEHPVMAVRRELEDLFERMGFAVVDGPEVETEYFNFEALNIPSWHPARDMQDTIWVEGNRVLRTHTSGVQIRSMQQYGAPLRVVSVGRVFRNETQDATHEHTFHQLEGLLIDEDISVGHLKGVLEALLKGIFGRPVQTRLRPFYFPFVEPGLELDFQCQLCEGKGCGLCKSSGWIELCGCGMVHPRVLEAGDIDPERYTGFAFGMGIDRLTMMRHAITDIRYFMSGDLRFFEQF